MSFISYAQNFEDLMLWRALRHIEHGFYIDIGACSPDEHSVTRAFYERGWHGINVEPNPEFLEELNDRRPNDKNLEFAISDHSGREKITIFGSTGLSTLDETVATIHERSGYSAECREVELITLRQLCEAYLPENQPVHFLKIDVEGLEQQVLQGNDWQTFRPWVVVVEATQPMSQVESYAEWETVLQKAHYRFCYADGLNRFYVATEHANLATAFRYPPNVFDDFISQSRWLAERSAEQANERLNQLLSNLSQEQKEQIRANTEAAEQRRRAETLDAELAAATERLETLTAKFAAAHERADELNRQVHHWRSVAGAARTELDAVYRSKSWRVTWPLRKAMRITRLLLRLPGRILRRSARLLMAAARRLLAGTAAFILRHERLKAKVLQWLRRHPELKTRLRRFVKTRELTKGGGPYDGAIRTDLVGGSCNDKVTNDESLAELTPHAQAIYLDLKSRVEKRKRVAD